VITIREIAEASGVSIATVSAVLSGKADQRRIAIPTRERVLHVARQLGYLHNALAKSLREGKSNMVGILGYGYPMMHHILRMEAAAKALIAVGFQVSVQNLGWQAVQADDLLRNLLSLRVDGLLLDGTGGTSSSKELLRDLACRRFPMAGLGLMENLPIDQVTVDREQGAYIAVRHLLELGHRRIAYAFAETTGVPVVQARLQGYRRAHVEANFPVDDSLLVPTHTEYPAYRAGYEAMQKVLQLRPRPTAVMTMDDQNAIGAIRAAFEAGLRVPEDIAIVGFSGFPEGEFCAVPLTTVAFPFDEMAREAVRMLMERMEGSAVEQEPRIVKFSPRLIVRRSCRGEKPFPEQKEVVCPHSL
jgi:LacI family purine nucleotide synthesis repressor